MQEEYFKMKRKDLERAQVCERLVNGLMKQKDAAKELSITVRHMRRLLERYREHGPPGLASRRVGQRSHNRYEDSLRDQVVELITNNYNDFGPTFASEILVERHGIEVSRETLRKWMNEAGIRKARKRRHARVHQHRERRPRFGELIQIDASPHEWLEGRGPHCTLITFIDDATSRLLYLRFAPTETTEAYMEGMYTYLKRWGRPLALYSDRHSIFRKTKEDALGDEPLTQFGRAMTDLGIDCIHSSSPEAHGRVERTHKTQQDRLIKLMRLEKINTVEEANIFLEKYMAYFNQRFGKMPTDPTDAHRPVLHTQEELDLIFCLQFKRKLSKNLTMRFENQLYQIQTDGPAYALRKAQITVCRSFSGAVHLLYNHRLLPYSIFAVETVLPPCEDSKTLNHRVDRTSAAAKRSVPAAEHPWRHSPIGKAVYTKFDSQKEVPSGL